MSKYGRPFDAASTFEAPSDDAHSPESRGIDPQKAIEKAQLESRSRMISFRVTVEEFKRFRKLCSQHGLRNVSEAVRLAVNQLLHEEIVHTTDSLISTRVSRLESRVESIESRLGPHSAKRASKKTADGDR